MRVVDLKVFDFMVEMYIVQCQTRVLLNQKFEQLAEMLRGVVGLGESSLNVSHSSFIPSQDRDLLPTPKQQDVGVSCMPNPWNNPSGSPTPKANILIFEYQNPRTLIRQCVKSFHFYNIAEEKQSRNKNSLFRR